MAYNFSVPNGKICRERKKRALLCPRCGRGRLMDESVSIKSEAHVIDADDAWPADYYTKCTVCKAQVGVRKIE